MLIDKIKEILHLGEGPNIEFKSHCPDANAIGPVVSGLLNTTAGGFIVCGFDDNTGNIIGIDDADAVVKSLEQALERGLSPGTLVEIHVQKEQDKDLIVLDVPAGRDPPYAFQNVIYKRTGAETKKADIETIRDLVLRRQVEPERWERRFSLANPNKDLDKEEIKTAITAIAKTGRLQINDQLPNISFLEQLSVFKYGRLTNGGDILFTTNPAIRNPQIRVRTARFTTDKNEDKFTDQKSFEGPLVQLLEDVFGFIQRNTSTASDFTTDSLTRRDIPQYPPDAIREGLVNAFAHRDYSNSSGGVFVNIYRDRLEIENTGKFPEGVTLDSISKGQISVLRNPDIAHVLYLRGKMENVGRGSVLIQAACIDHGLPLPKWSETNQGVRLTFFAFRETHVIPHEINPGIKRMLNVLEGDMSRRELQEILNLKDEGNFRKTYLKPAVQQNLISLTIPEKPYSNKQKYRLTKKGQSLRDQK